MFSHKTLKVSEEVNKHYFFAKNFNHAFLPAQNFKKYKNNSKKDYQEIQGYLAEDAHKEPDHPSAFMKMMKALGKCNVSYKDDRRQVLNPRVIWDGSIDRFEVFRKHVKGHYGQISTGYLFDTEFQTAYIERGTDCYADFLDEVPSASQIKKDAHALYDALLSACQGCVGCRIFNWLINTRQMIIGMSSMPNQYEKVKNVVKG